MEKPYDVRLVIEKVRSQLKAKGVSMHANASLADYIDDFEMECIEEGVKLAMEGVLDALLIDRENDPNAKNTAARVAKMYVREVFKGRYLRPPEATSFPNVVQGSDMFVAGPWGFNSACSHHLVPIIGKAWVGVLSGNALLGLSKFGRITEHIMSRPQIQEEATQQLVEALHAAFAPRGVGVIVQARHFCACWRGVRDAGTVMITQAARGTMNLPHQMERMLGLMELAK